MAVLYLLLRTIIEGGDVQTVTTMFDGTQNTHFYQADKLMESNSSCGVTTVVDSTIDSKTQEEIPNVITTTLPNNLQSVTTITKTYAQDAEGNDDFSQQTVSIDLNGKTSTFFHDTEEGLQSVTTAEGREYTVNYDPLTLLTQSEQVSGLESTTYSYDSRGRRIQATTGERTTIYTYNDAVSKGNLTSVTAPDGKVTSYEYDVMGRVSKVTYPDGHSTESQYDNNGNLTVLVVPTQQNHSFSHNGTNNVSSESTPLNEVTQYSYDKERNLTQITLPSGQLITNTYESGLITTTATPEGDINYQYTCGSKVSQINEGTESLNYSYDGNLLTSISYNGELDQNISQSYDNNFWLTGLSYAGQTASLSYDNDGNLTAIHGYSINRHEGHALPESIVDTDLTQNRSYNSYGELITESNRVNGDAIYNYSLTRNNLGRIAGKTETINDTTHEYEYSYNDKRQLVSVSKNGTEVEAYSYDENGNRTNSTSTERGVSSISASYNNPWCIMKQRL